jgi:hypothetical protein
MPRFALLSQEESQRLTSLAEKAVYCGNPTHKRNPGDFGLTPPSAPRPAKSLCDVTGIFTRQEAERLLREGLRRGLVSTEEDHGWPKAVWAVSENGFALEARLDNRERGSYHGYPLPPSDPLAKAIIVRWGRPDG